MAADPVRDTLLFLVDQREGYVSGERIAQDGVYEDFERLFEYADVQTVQFAQSLVYVLADETVRYFGFCRGGLCGVDERGDAIIDSAEGFEPQWREMNLPFYQAVLRTIQTANDTLFVVTVKNEVYALGNNADYRLCTQYPGDVTDTVEIRLNNVNAAKAGEATAFFQSGAQLYVCGSNYYADDLKITASARDRLDSPYALSDIRGQARDVGVFRTRDSLAVFVIAENGSVFVRGQISTVSLGACGDSLL